MKTYPSNRADKFIARLPDGLRDQIAAAAKAAGRSMNTEVVRALRAAFVEPVRPDQLTPAEIAELRDLLQLIRPEIATAEPRQSTEWMLRDALASAMHFCIGAAGDRDIPEHAREALQERAAQIQRALSGAST